MLRHLFGSSRARVLLFFHIVTDIETETALFERDLTSAPHQRQRRSRQICSRIVLNRRSAPVSLIGLIKSEMHHSLLTNGVLPKGVFGP